jgi:uncharacterized protein (DUF885 family)
MKALHSIILFSCFTLAGCSDTTKTLKVKPNKALHDLFDRYYQERLKLFPLEATSIGDPRYNNLLPNDESAEVLSEEHNFFTKYLTESNGFKPEELTLEDKISFLIFQDILKTALDGEQYHYEMMPFNQMSSLPLSMGQMGSGKGSQPFENVKDYENWLQRIDAFAVWTDSAIANCRKGMKAGMVMPKKLVLKMIPQMESLTHNDTATLIFYGPLKQFPASFSANDKKRLTQLYMTAITEKLIPSYKKLAVFFSGDYLLASRSTDGINALPNGKAMYNYAIYVSTTCHKTPDEIYQNGLSEVVRITAEMEKVKEKTGFKGTLKELFAFMQTDKQFMPFKTEKEVIESNKAIQNKITPHLKTLFSVVPKTPFEIRAVEAFRASVASPSYQQGSADGSRPGIYYIPIVDPTKVNVTSCTNESTFLHEAIPGHHYQISLSQEDTTLPTFRRFSEYSAFEEGWALYSESLGEQLGCYTDPYQRMGAYGDEVLRAIRLVVDVGIHTGKMTREEAIAYMTEHEAITQENAVAEIERYMAWPGQALAYKTGELKIKELRDKYMNQLGPKFSLRDFHDALLKGSAMPLSILDLYMDAWAKASAGA